MIPTDFVRELFGDPFPPGTRACIWRKTGKCSTWIAQPADADVFAGERDIFIGACLGDQDHGPKHRLSMRADDGRLPVAVCGLYLDLDVNGSPGYDGSVKVGAAPSVKVAMEAAELVASPTILVASGGGVQAWWLFEGGPHVFRDDEDRAAFAALSLDWLAEHRRQVEWKIDGTADLPRLLRLVGSVNTKGGFSKPVTILAGGGPRYRLANLRVLIHTHTPPGAIVFPATARVDGLDAEVSPRSARVARLRDEPGSDQSAADFALAVAAAEDGHSDPEIAELLRYRRRRASDGDPKQKGDNAEYLGRTIAAARAALPPPLLHRIRAMQAPDAPMDLDALVRAISPVVGTVTIVEAAHGKDASDHIQAGLGLEGLVPVRTDTVAASAGTTPALPNQPPRQANPRPGTDIGNAERLIDRFGHVLRYCVPWKCWLIWDGRRWRRDDTLQITAYAKETVRAIGVEASALEEDARRAMLKWALTSEGERAVKAMVNLARADQAIAIAPAALDADPYLLNVRNGTVDLRTGDLLPHDPGNLITKLADVEYDITAEAEFFNAFLQKVLPDTDVRDFVQVIVGSALVGLPLERMLPLAYGTGANGKSTLLELLLRLLGDYSSSCDPDLLIGSIASGGNTPALADLHGVRLVVGSETSKGCTLNTSRVKHITGNDTIRACRKYEHPFEFEPSHTLVIATNHRPKVTDGGDAIWARLRLIPFNVKIENQIPRPMIDERLDQEASGILNWLLAGCRTYLDHGVPPQPADVRDATDEYAADENVIGKFIADRCIPGATAQVASSKLYDAYKAWAADCGERQQSQRDFNNALKDEGFQQKKLSTGMTWLDVDLAPTDAGS